MANTNKHRIDLDPEDLNEILLMLIRLGLQADQRKRKAPAGAANTNQGSPKPHNNDEVTKGASLLWHSISRM